MLYVGQKLCVFGGGDGRRAENHVLLIDLQTYACMRLTARGNPPQERVGHAAALVKGHQLIIMGGFVRKLGYMFDVHCLDLNL